MQIHEITKLNKQRTDEGLLDDFKEKVGLPVTGKTPVPPKSDNRNWIQKIAGVAPNAPDKNSPEWKEYQAKLDKQTKELEKYWTDKGYDINSSPTSELDKVIKQVQNNPKLQQTINNLNDEFAVAMPGYEIKVHSDKTNGDYYKDDSGQWWNDNFPRQRITDPASIQGLEQLANQGKGKEQASPATIAAKQAQELAAQKKNKNQPVAEAVGDRKIKNTFYGWIRPKIELIKDSNNQQISLNSAMNETPALKTKLSAIFKQMLSANDQGNQGQVKELFKQFVTVALAGLINERNRLAKEQGGESTLGSDENELGVATGDVDADKLAKEISPEGLKLLSRMPSNEVAPTIEKVVNAVKKQS